MSPEEEEKKSYYQYYEQVNVQKIHHFYISSSIEDPCHYVDMIHKIQSASPDDIVYLHLNTEGGWLDTGIQLINAIQSSNAHIVCSIESRCYSLGTLIFLAADEFVVHDDCTMMIHNYSGGVYGKGNEQVARLDATIKWFEQLARKYYIPFLTEQELNLVLKGQDIWMHSDEIKSRLENMVKIIEAKKAEELARAEMPPAPKAKKVPKPKRENKPDNKSNPT